MALLNVIRRWHFREHLSIREIGRRTGPSRNTVRRYLRVDGGFDVLPEFDTLFGAAWTTGENAKLSLRAALEPDLAVRQVTA